MIECSLLQKEGFYESYTTKYWDKSEEFAKQVSQTVYTRSKGKHKQVEAFVMKSFNVKRKDIISVIYQ